MWPASGHDATHRPGRSAAPASAFEPRSAVGPRSSAPSFREADLDLAVHHQCELVVRRRPPLGRALGTDRLDHELAVLADRDLLVRLELCEATSNTFENAYRLGSSSMMSMVPFE